MNINLRVASSDEDRAAIYRLRYELYVEDQHLFQDEADHERRWLIDEYDRYSQLVLAEVDGRIVGTLRLTATAPLPFFEELRKTYEISRFRNVLDDGDIFVVTRLVVRPEHRGSDLSFRLFGVGCKLAAEQDIDLIVGNCEIHLLSHYEKFGFRSYGELYSHPTNGVLASIALVTGDLDHLSKIKSPLHTVLSRRAEPPDQARVARIVTALTERAAVTSKFLLTTRTYMAEVSDLISDVDGLCGLIPDLTLAEARMLLQRSPIMACQGGDAIIRKGHVTRTLYMLLAGSLEVGDEQGLLARVTDRGTIVGEVAFFSPGERIRDVLAGPEGARVLALNDATLRALIAENGPVAAKFLHFVACGLAAKLRSQAAPRVSAPPPVVE
jgi:predicted GNAT family N-acyltransferase